MAGDPFYTSAAWRRLRLIILERDEYQCRIRGAKCRGRADTCHHVKPRNLYPELSLEPSNLVAACGTCNYGLGNQARRDTAKGLPPSRHW